MTTNARARRALIAASSVAGLTLAALPGTASAAPVAPEPAKAVSAVEGTYAAAATSSFLTLLGLSVPTVIDLVDVDLGPTEATAGTGEDPRTAASAENLVGAIGGVPGLAGILLSAEATAPPDGDPVTDTLIDVPDNPLLSADVVNVSADANWAGDDQCVAADVPLSEGITSVAGLSLLDAGLPAPLDGGVLSTLGDGAVTTSSTTSLPSIEGPNDRRAVQSEAAVQTAGLNLLGAIDVEVVAPPTLTATVTGDPGGASVDYSAPLVRVSVMGEPAIELDPNGAPLVLDLGDATVELDFLDALLGDLGIDLPVGSTLEDLLGQILDPVLDAIPLDALLDVTLAAGQVANEEIAEDGTSASASASLVTANITLFGGLADLGLPVPIPPVTLLDLAVAPMAVGAEVSAGGLFCGDPENPLDGLNKTASVAEVQPGGTFDYSITVPNGSDTCTLTDVRVEDDVIGPAGSQVTDTDPDADSITPNSDSSTITVVWDDVGPIAPGESRTLRIRVLVPTTATPGQSYDDVLEVSALCDGTTFTNDVTLNDIPRIVGTAPTRLARTGGTESSPVVPLVAGVLVVAAVAAGALRRRGATA